MRNSASSAKCPRPFSFLPFNSISCPCPPSILIPLRSGNCLGVFKDPPTVMRKCSQNVSPFINKTGEYFFYFTLKFYCVAECGCCRSEKWKRTSTNFLSLKNVTTLTTRGPSGPGSLEVCRPSSYDCYATDIVTSKHSDSLTTTNCT